MINIYRVTPVSGTRQSTSGHVLEFSDNYLTGRHRHKELRPEHVLGHISGCLSIYSVFLSQPAGTKENLKQDCEGCMRATKKEQQVKALPPRPDFNAMNLHGRRSELTSPNCPQTPHRHCDTHVPPLNK